MLTTSRPDFAPRGSVAEVSLRGDDPHRLRVLGTALRMALREARAQPGGAASVGGSIQEGAWLLAVGNLGQGVPTDGRLRARVCGEMREARGPML